MKKVLLFIVAVIMAQVSFACTASLYTSSYASGSLFLQYYFSNSGSSFGTIPAGYHKETTFRFGDGYSQTVTGSTSYALHTYAATGTYTAKLIIRVVDSMGTTIYCADSTTSSITVSYPACADSIYISYGSGGAVTFTAHNPAGTTGISRYWTFGDGGTGTGTPVTHTYAYNGTYTVYLQDTNSTIPCTYFNSITVNITSASWHCALDTARFHASVAGPTATFTSTTMPPSGMYMKYRWDYGDGSSVVTSSSHVSNHTYTTTGTFTVKLVTMWVDSPLSTIYCSDSITHSITVSGWSCGYDTARFTASASSYTAYFSSSTHAPSPLLTKYKWDFGDGSAVYTTYSSTTNHTYSSFTTYTVKLITQWYDSATSTVICQDSITHSVTTGSSYSCVNDTARFTASVSGAYASFYSPSSAPSPLKMRYKWNYGDGSSIYTSYSHYANHTYSTSGTYTVKLITQWYDSTAGTVICQDSITHNVSITVPYVVPGISGYIFKDSTYAPDTAIYKIWLIKYDSSTYTISAVDSMIDTGIYYAYYHFDSIAAGKYLVKAAITNGPTSGTGYVPTYHATSAIWSTATYINYTSGAMTGVNITMQHGTVTGGPGFIAGDVRYGAGKSTAVGDPVANLLIMIQDDAGNLVTSTYTDAAGHYSVTDLPLGHYIVYPEKLGYNTTAWISLNVNPFKTSYTDIDFKQTSTAIKPNPAGVATVTTSQSFAIYPNPNKGKMTLQWDNTIPGNAIVDVNNVLGQKVYSTNVKLDATGRAELNLAQLEAGVYFINVMAGDAHFYQKIVIQR